MRLAILITLFNVFDFIFGIIIIKIKITKATKQYNNIFIIRSNGVQS